MDELVLHSYRRCPFAIRVRMTLEEKAIHYKVIEENLSDFSPELLALHPEGRVPLLIHYEGDGGDRGSLRPSNPRVIYQSTVITEYLDEAFGGPKLMPPSPGDRAKARLWTYWCDTLFKPDLDAYKYELKNLSEAEQVKLVTRLEGYLTEWNAALAESEFLLGSGLTLADIHLFPFARQFRGIKPEFPGFERYSHIWSWLEKIMARPSFERVMRKS